MGLPASGPKTQAPVLSRHSLTAYCHWHGSLCLPRIRLVFLIPLMRWGCGTLQNGSTRHIFFHSTSSEIAYGSIWFSRQLRLTGSTLQKARLSQGPLQPVQPNQRTLFKQVTLAHFRTNLQPAVGRMRRPFPPTGVFQKPSCRVTKR